MAGGNYWYCEVCDQKALYVDSDTAEANVEVVHTECLEKEFAEREQRVRDRIAADVREWLNLTDATVIHAEAGQTLVFAFTHKHSLAQDEELLQRLRASIPGHRIVIADGVGVGVGETEQQHDSEK